MDRRLNPRIASQTRVKLYFNGQSRINAHLTDFSQGGVSVTLDQFSRAPGINEVIFMLPDNMDEAYSMKVLRCDEMEWVLSFVE